MGNAYQDQYDAFEALLTAVGLTVYDGEVPDGHGPQYVLIYAHFETPDGAVAVDAVPLTGTSVEVSPRMYVHSVGSTPASARATAARVRAAVIDAVLAVAGRTCSPVRWREGSPPRRDEEIPGLPAHYQVDVYGWRAVATS